MTKTYGSKKEIYKDYLIAVKFVPAFEVRFKSNYDRLIKQLERVTGGRSELAAKGITNFDGSPLQSFAYFLEQEVKDDAGKPMGSRYVLLTHETGLEVFIPWLVPIAKGAAGAVGGFLAKKALDASFQPMCDLIREQWTALIDPEGGHKIARVEIRTEEKGVMSMPFSKFDPDQISCLASRWDKIAHISEANATCFDGALVDPPSGAWGEKDPRARDA